MTVLETIFAIVGAVIVAHLIIAALSHFSQHRPKRPAYTLDQPWDGDVLLWTATDEVVAGGGGHHGAHEAIGHAELIGGRASGRY